MPVLQVRVHASVARLRVIYMPTYTERSTSRLRSAAPDPTLERKDAATDELVPIRRT